MKHLLRVIQLALAFLTVQLTLKYLGLDAYVFFNKVMFVYLVALSFSQVNLNMVWKKKSYILYDFSIFFIVCFFVSFSLGLSTGIAWLAAVYAFSRLVERYVYCSMLADGGFYKGQVFIVFLYSAELILIFFIYKGVSERFNASEARVVYAALMYFVFSVITYFIIIRKSKQKISFIYYVKNIFSNLEVLLYFLLSVVILNMDRYFAESLDDDVAGFLFSLSVAGAVFSILSIEIDKLKSKITTGLKVNSSNSAFFVPVFLVLGLFYWFFISYFSFVSGFFKIGDVNIFSVASIFFLYGAIYSLMYASTPFLISGGLRSSLIILTLCFLFKLMVYYISDLVVANFLTGLLLMFFLFASGLITLRRDCF